MAKRIIWFSAGILVALTGSAIAANPGTNYVGNFWLSDPTTPANTLKVNADGSINTASAPSVTPTVVKPDASTATGYQQITSLATAVTIAPGAGSTYCNVTTEGAAVRFRGDGTAPTAAVGMPLEVGQVAAFRLSAFTALQFIQQAATATLDVDCYKDS